MKIPSLFLFILALFAHIGSPLFAQPDHHKIKTLEVDLPYLKQLQDIVEKKQLYDQRNWHLLLHYTKQWSGAYKSSADGSGFFMDPDGFMDPKKELLATLESFFQSESLGNLHSQCRFPARFDWLKNQLKMDTSRLPKPECVEQIQFLKKFKYDSLSIVFVSFSMEYAASLFGHTFLKFNQNIEQHNVNSDLTINYGAMVPDIDPVRYIIYAFTGGFHGSFEILPYQNKILEYNHKENRNLWEYELTLNKQEINRMLLHLWEMRSTHFDYFFNSENCSSMLVSLLEVARPSLSMQPKLPPLQKQSADVIKLVVDSPGLLHKVIYRPAVKTSYLEKFKLLSDKERNVLEEYLFKNRFPVGSLSEVRQQLVLDIASEYYLYMANTQGDEKKEDYKNKYLDTKAKVHDQNSLQQIPGYQIDPDISNPYFGHKTSHLQFNIGGGYLGNYNELFYRPNLHELVDASAGYSSFAELIFGGISVRQYQDVGNRLWLNEFVLFRFISLNHSNAFLNLNSWHIEAGFKDRSHFIVSDEKINRMNAYFEVGPGKAFQFLGYGYFDSFVLYAFTILNGNTSLLDANIGLTLRAGVLWRINPLTALKFEVDQSGYYLNNHYIDSKKQLVFNSRIVDRVAFQAKIQLETELNLAQYSMGLKIYF